ncbi:Gp19/Gp15/Gp42 family protein [Nocardia australiensis]|uniref:Gp19/Gp15/Gp42 family protein n=1 Tax=Nocardia australiensis TaxID=2887191 RepID=UPI001D1419AC|nr:Gp19/Gp15/Gp42 family protein [Nocardia australiensis]
MAFAMSADLAARWRALSPEEEARAAVLLGDAAFWLKAWFKPYAADLEALAADNELLADGLKIVSCAMVRRSMTNGGYDGASQVQQTMGPFTAQVSYSNPNGNLYIYDTDRDTLFGLLGINVSGAVSMTSPGL